MKKVIILCSALVFDFLTCSDASAAVNINSVSYQNAREAIEDELTELLKASNEKEVKLYINKFESRLNSSPKKAWLNSSEMIIENSRVKFKNSNSKGYKSDPKLFRDYLSDVRKRINQLQIESQQRESAPIQGDLEQVQRGNEDNQTSKERSFGGKLIIGGAVAGGTAAGMQLIRNRQTDTKSGTDENTSIAVRQNTSVNQFNAVQTVGQPQIEGKTGTLALPAPDNRTEEGNSRLALPAPQGNSENQRHQVEEGNSENSEPYSNDSTPSSSRRSSDSSNSDSDRNSESLSNASTPSISHRSSVAKGTHPEPANLIPWSSQNSSSGQNYAENNRIEGGNRERLALPAFESDNSEATNSGNQDGWTNKGNSYHLSPISKDGFGSNEVSQSPNTENIMKQIADKKIQAQKANTEDFSDAPDSNIYKYAEKEVDAFGNEHEIGESSNPQFIDPTGAVGNQNSDNNLNYLDANQGMGSAGSQNFIGGSGTRPSLPGGK